MINAPFSLRLVHITWLKYRARWRSPRRFQTTPRPVKSWMSILFQKAVPAMQLEIGLYHLWLYYVLAYALAYPMQMWANSRRGEPFDDPEFLFRDKRVFVIALAWLIGGLAISLFVPLGHGLPFCFGLVLYIVGLILSGVALYSFAHSRGLATQGIHRYSRNPIYVGWSAALFGMCLMGWATTLGAVLFLAYCVATLPYFHWTVLLEEKFLTNKYGEAYRTYLQNTSRYLGFPKSNRR
jgi:protein-S-isoprenylcysteine O-methyltransferase Ste14